MIDDHDHPDRADSASENESADKELATPRVADSGRAPAASHDSASGTGMTPEQLAEAKEYGRLGLICDLMGRGLDLVYLAAMAFFIAVPGGWLINRIDALTDVETIRLIVLLCILVLGNMALSFPLAFYTGHVLEHRYQLSRQSFAGWLWRYAKWRLLEIALMGALIPGLYWIIWLTGSWWWLVGAVAYFFVSVVLGRLFPNVIMPLFHKFEKLEPTDPKNTDLMNRMKRLAAGTGLSIEGVYRMEMSEETAKGNAMLAGLGQTRRVILGDNLLDEFSPEEIEVIMAHEIGHHVYRHITKIIFGVLFVSLAGFWICDALLLGWLRSLDVPLATAQGFPYYTLPMFLLIMTMFGLLIGPVHCAVSRRFERQCDRYALDQTGLHDAYRSAFRKLSILNKDDPDPHSLEVFMFHDHPPINERIAAADAS